MVYGPLKAFGFAKVSVLINFISRCYGCLAILVIFFIWFSLALSISSTIGELVDGEIFHFLLYSASKELRIHYGAGNCSTSKKYCLLYFSLFQANESCTVVLTSTPVNSLLVWSVCPCSCVEILFTFSSIRGLNIHLIFVKFISKVSQFFSFL